MIPTVKQNNSWAQPVGSDSGSGKGGFLGRNQSGRFSMDDLTAALYKQEERENKVDQILPFPLEQVDTFVSVINTNIIELKKTLLEARRSGLLKQAEKKLIEKNTKRLKAIEHAFKEFEFDIDKMRL